MRIQGFENKEIHLIARKSTLDGISLDSGAPRHFTGRGGGKWGYYHTQWRLVHEGRWGAALPKYFGTRVELL